MQDLENVLSVAKCKGVAAPMQNQQQRSWPVPLHLPGFHELRDTRSLCQWSTMLIAIVRPDYRFLLRSGHASNSNSLETTNYVFVERLRAPKLIQDL